MAQHNKLPSVEILSVASKKLEEEIDEQRNLPKSSEEDQQEVFSRHLHSGGHISGGVSDMSGDSSVL